MFLSGIDIGGTSIKFGIFDEQLNLLQQWSRPTPKEPAEAAALIAAQLEPYHVAAIGAGAPGTLNAARETITADNLAWVDVPLAALLRRAPGLPAVVINDGHAAMLAEMRSGALQNVQTGILLTLGTGIGGGIVINGQCWRSPTGLAPELGHIITHSDGLPCLCGQCGCFEQYASATALIRMAGGESPADLIAREELTAAGLDQEIWQCPVVLLADVRSVGVQGDGRTYGHPIVLRPVSSEDAMTADWTRLPYDVLARISTRITNSVPEVNRVVLDVTSKPPATIEWE